MRIDQSQKPEECIRQFAVHLHTLIAVSPAMKAIEPLNFAPGLVRWSNDVNSKISALEARLSINRVQAKRKPIRNRKIKYR